MAIVVFFMAGTLNSAAAATVPPLSPAVRAVGFVDVRTLVPDAVVDLRYASKHNFTGVRLYPTNARCLVHTSMAPGLRAAAKQLRKHKLVLVFWDCYRPHSVQQEMWRAVPNPTWVAMPGPYSRSHESGRSVDVSIASATTHKLLDMGTGFDDFTSKAGAYAMNVSATARANRATLRKAMESNGSLRVYSGEWWHFDGPGAALRRPIINVPVN